MNDSPEDSLSQWECEVLASTDTGRVVIKRVPRKEFDALQVEQRGRLKRVMEMWCQGHKLPETMFNHNEGRTAAKRMLQAFKAFKVRLYGFERKLQGQKTFVIVDIDAAKKQNKADPGILKRAKRRVDETFEGMNE